MNTDHPQHLPLWAQGRRRGARMSCCLLTAGLVALCLASAGFFGITGQLVPFWDHTQSKPPAAIPIPEPVHQVNLQAGLTKRDPVDSRAVLPEPTEHPRVAHLQSERINEQKFDKSGQLVPFVREHKKPKRVILPFPWIPYAIPSPWRSVPKTNAPPGVLPMPMDFPMVFVRPASPSPTPPSSAPSGAPTAGAKTIKGSRTSHWQRHQQAVWNRAVAKWAKEEKIEVARLVQEDVQDYWYLTGLDIWNQYQDWFYAQADFRNFLYKRDFILAVIERYQLWVPGTYLPDQCQPIVETKYTKWDDKKEFPCIVAIARLQELNPGHREVRKKYTLPKDIDEKKTNVDRPPAIAARYAEPSRPKKLVPLVLPADRGDDDDYLLSCEFRINKSGNIEIRCPGLFSTDGKTFDLPESRQKQTAPAPSVVHKDGPVGETVEVDLRPPPTPSKASTTPLPPLHSAHHGVGPYVPSNLSLPSPSSTSIAPYAGQATRIPTGHGPVVHPTPSPSAAASYKPLEIIIKTQMVLAQQRVKD
ncbi:hypothetical protein QBC41DRAFT_386206 [Cercophora samala]|uniref:Uncharacterized protein n=1 Tax=Cercophora samala TaxID=330535 RepID=A0AA39YMQ4_9PEZI|nr:hypothetical protein QBC41DRAFT_386206 [Cercophora samala]